MNLLLDTSTDASFVASIYGTSPPPCCLLVKYFRNTVGVKIFTRSENLHSASSYRDLTKLNVLQHSSTSSYTAD